MSDSRLTANGSADLESLTDMVHKLLDIAWGDHWGTFSEEKPVDNDADKATMPYIAYNLINRVHTANKTIKWQQFATEPDPLHKGETLTSYRCWFTCQVEFTIFDDTNRGATRLARKFEEFMETYIGYFKQEGISEIVFKEEKAPNVSTLYRQDLPYRTLAYEVRIERIMMISSYDLNRVDIVLNEVDVDLTVQHPSGNIDHYESELTNNNPVTTHLGPSGFLDVYNKNFPSIKGGN